MCERASERGKKEKKKPNSFLSASLAEGLTVRDAAKAAPAHGHCAPEKAGEGSAAACMSLCRSCRPIK